jgi:uncharacterized protein YaiL (DUF2058 family)
MAGSLQDQLLNMGLSNKKKAKQIDITKRKQAKQCRKNKTEVVNKAKELADKVLAKEKERSRLLNVEKTQQAEKKAVAAQIKQLINLNRVENKKKDKNTHEVIYNFTDAGKIKHLYITTALQTALSLGQLAIVKQASSYELVPFAIAKKIQERDKNCVIQIKQKNRQKEHKEAQEDDPYADYQIPDDLMW